MKYILLTVLMIAGVVHAMDDVASTPIGDKEKKEQAALPTQLGTYLEGVKRSNGDSLLHVVIKEEKILRERLAKLEDPKLSSEEEVKKRKEYYESVGAKNQIHYEQLVRENIYGCVDNLLKLGLDINSQNEAGKTPLYLAVKYRLPELVTLLLARGADVNIPDEDGVTPLAVACITPNNATILKTLLQRSSSEVVTKTLFQPIGGSNGDYKHVMLQVILPSSLANAKTTFAHLWEITGSDRERSLVAAINTYQQERAKKEEAAIKEFEATVQLQKSKSVSEDEEEESGTDMY